jgi:hypothetical protein
MAVLDYLGSIYLGSIGCSSERFVGDAASVSQMARFESKPLGLTLAASATKVYGLISKNVSTDWLWRAVSRPKNHAGSLQEV